MKQAIGYNETTGVMGGARPLDTYDLDLPLGGNSLVFTGTTYTKVMCKDGTSQTQQSSPNAKYMDACINNGGRAVNQPVVVNTEVYAKPNLSPEEKFYESLGITTKGGYDATIKAKGRLLVALVLIAGYFAYKKFKK